MKQNVPSTLKSVIKCIFHYDIQRWDEGRKQMIIKGNGGILYHTTSAPKYSTSQKPMSSVSMPTHGRDAHTNEVGTADTGHAMTIIGIIIAILLALIFIALIVIWRSRKNDHTRVSIQHPSQSGEPDRVHADTEPVRTHSYEMPSTSLDTVAIQKQKRWPGVRNVSMLIRHTLGINSKHGSIFFNKQSESVPVPLLNPAPDFPNGDRKGKGRAACQTIQSLSRPVMESDSHFLSTSSDVATEICERENMYNPLTSQPHSIPYDYLVIGTTGSGAHNTDPVITGYPSDNGANLENGDQKSHPFFILEKEVDIHDTDFVYMDEGQRNAISDTRHSFRADDKCESNEEYYNCVLETVDSSTDSNYVNTSTNDSAVQFSNTS
ncbi:hypothetical protein ACJMK2_016411 [Sinanodonta woodiana]|uniref:Uncharacterized protein n=1 Tax=Sinanodonta woodiana TaxID=1069815 RepID=A0ABD3UUL9_SINWO